MESSLYWFTDSCLYKSATAGLSPSAGEVAKARKASARADSWLDLSWLCNERKVFRSASSKVRRVSRVMRLFWIASIAVWLLASCCRLRKLASSAWARIRRLSDSAKRASRNFRRRTDFATRRAEIQHLKRIDGCVHHLLGEPGILRRVRDVHDISVLAGPCAYRLPQPVDSELLGYDKEGRARHRGRRRDRKSNRSRSSTSPYEAETCRSPSFAVTRLRVNLTRIESPEEVGST